jgi:hypothetical protein
MIDNTFDQASLSEVLQLFTTLQIDQQGQKN